MTNAGIQGLIDQAGNRMFAISYDNNVVELYGYTDLPVITDRVELMAPAGEDLIVTHHTANCNGTTLGFRYFHNSECVQWIGIIDESTSKYNPDPLVIKGW